MATRRTCAIAALVAIAGLAAALAAGSRPLAPEAKAAGAQRPNFVVVMTDDQTLREMRALPYARRQLGRRGVRFANGIASYPLCCPSRVSFLTGQYAHNHGVLDNHGPNGGYANYDDAGSLPIALAADGYRTALIGKYLNGYGKGDDPVRPAGWTRWLARVAGGYFDYELFNGNSGRLERYGARPRDYLTDVLSRKANGFVRRSSRRPAPFFMWLSMYAPHTENLPDGARFDPRPAPRHEGRFRDAKLPRTPAFNERNVSDKPSFIARRDRLDAAQIRKLRKAYRSRLAALLAVDDAIRSLTRTLRRSGELRRTYVMLVSDNGYLFGEHRSTRKTLFYEESIRVPMYLRGPGVPAGRVVRQPVANIDIAPTIYDVTGVESRREVDGRSLIPIARDRGLGRGREILLENKASTGIRTARYVYAEHRTRRGIELELYDLKKDPHQLRSVHDTPGYQATRAALAARLDQLRDCAGTSCR